MMEDAIGLITPALFLMLFVAPIIHIFLDHNPARRTRGRVLELIFFWWISLSGAQSMAAGFGHILPGHQEIADQIGFAHSPFQWEVGFADIAIGALLLLAAWKRGDYIVPALLAFAILYIGDAIGHIIQWVEHDNTEPYNIYVIPTDFGQPIIAIVLYLLIRRERPEALTKRVPQRAHESVAPAA